MYCLLCTSFELCSWERVLLIVDHDECERSLYSPYALRVPMELSQIAFHTIVLPKDDRTDCAQEEQLGPSILDHDSSHLCFDRRIQISGYSDHGIGNNGRASSILTCV